MEEIAEKIFNKAFEDFAKGLKEGLPDLEIPSLDPLEIPGKEEVELESFIAYIAASFSDVKVVGLSTLQMPKVEKKDRKIKASVSTKPIEAKGNYTLNGHAIKFLSIAADSDFTCSMVSLSLTISLELTDEKTEAFDPKVKVETKFEDMKLTINGLDEAGKIVGKLVNSLLSKFSETISKFLQKKIGDVMQRALQKVVDKFKDEFGAEVDSVLKGVKEATAEIDGVAKGVNEAIDVAKEVKKTAEEVEGVVKDIQEATTKTEGNLAAEVEDFKPLEQ